MKVPKGKGLVLVFKNPMETASDFTAQVCEVIRFLLAMFAARGFCEVALIGVGLTKVLG
mgnify:CR=1 FL=1